MARDLRLWLPAERAGSPAAIQGALDLGVLDVLETSVNIFDQQCLETVLPKAAQSGLGVIAKRPMASAFWQGHDVGNPVHQAYFTRRDAMGFTPSSLGFGGDWPGLCLRFAAHQDSVHSSLTATRKIEHFRESLDNYHKGRFPCDLYRKLRNEWKNHDDGSWAGCP